MPDCQLADGDDLDRDHAPNQLQKQKAPPARTGRAFMETGNPERRLYDAFALGALASQLAGAANGFSLLASLLLGRFFKVVPALHLTEGTLPLHLLFQRLQGLIDIIVADCDVNDGTSPASKFDNAYRLVAAYIIAH